jgi:hypothetical protein
MAGLSAGGADGVGDGTSMRPLHPFAVSGIAGELHLFGYPIGG